MKAPADKSLDNQRQAAAHETPQQQDRSDTEFQFVDNRAETVGLRQLQEVADNSPPEQGLSQLKAMMDSSLHGTSMQNLQTIIDNSPRQAAQRQQHSRVLGATMSLPIGSDDVSVQRAKEDELLQGQFAAESPAQLAQQPDPKPNNTGLPDNLKAGVESLSGLSLDDVKVHYNSTEPAQLNAHAYAQGTDIHVGPGQEQHLPHEAWHVVQQAQGRVKPTTQMKDGMGVNDNQGLEREADLMGARAAAGVVQARRELGGSVVSDPIGMETDHTHRSPRTECRNASRPKTSSATGPTAILQAKFTVEQTEEATEDLERIQEFLNANHEAQDEATDRSARTDMALGLTVLRSNSLKGRNVRDLMQWMEAAKLDGEEQKILARCEALLARAEGRANNTNLRIFGDKVAATTWMDWVPVDITVQGQYRTWFEECATKPLLANDGRFKFNLSGFKRDYVVGLVDGAKNISQQEMDRRVDGHEISKTDWEILEVLSNPSLFGRTDFLLFDKRKAEEPTIMDEGVRGEWHVAQPITNVDHEIYLARIAEETQQKEVAEAEQARFTGDVVYRIQLLRARFEEELEGTGKTMEDEEVQKAFVEAEEEAGWEGAWNTFDELWGNGSESFFRNLNATSE